MAPPQHRRKHTKSRNGCTECKRRKYKCDEQAPACFNCRRYGVPCSLSSNLDPGEASGSQSSTPVPSQLSIFASPPSTSAEASPGRSSVSLGTTSSSTFPGPGLTPPPPPPPLLSREPWSRDAELMHHYCTVTADSMALRDDMRHLWRVVKPIDGYEHSFIMHILLALAAVHKAHLVPARRQTYLNISAHHQVLGSEEFRTLLRDVDININAGAWRPIFCFSTCMVAYYLCQPVRSPEGRLEAPLGNTLDFLSAVRGIRATVDPFTPLVMASEYAPGIYGLYLPPEYTDMTDSPPLPNLDQSPLPIDTFAALYHLRSFYETDLPAHSLPSYLLAVSGLQTSARLIAMAGPAAEPGAVFFWPSALQETLIADMHALEPRALLLLAHFAVFWAVLEPNFWFTRGWARSLIQDISGRLAGDAILSEYLRWPSEQIMLLSL